MNPIFYRQVAQYINTRGKLSWVGAGLCTAHVRVTADNLNAWIAVPASPAIHGMWFWSAAWRNMDNSRWSGKRFLYEPGEYLDRELDWDTLSISTAAGGESNPITVADAITTQILAEPKMGWA